MTDLINWLISVILVRWCHNDNDGDDDHACQWWWLRRWQRWWWQYEDDGSICRQLELGWIWKQTKAAVSADWFLSATPSPRFQLQQKCHIYVAKSFWRHLLCKHRTLHIIRPGSFQIFQDMPRANSKLKHECSAGCSLLCREMEIEKSEPLPIENCILFTWCTLHHTDRVHISCNKIFWYWFTPHYMSMVDIDKKIVWTSCRVSG